MTDVAVLEAQARALQESLDSAIDWLDRTTGGIDDVELVRSELRHLFASIELVIDAVREAVRVGRPAGR